MALRLYNRRWYPLTFLIPCVVVVVVWLLFARGRTPELLLSVLGGIGGFTYFLYRQHLDEAKLFKELFAEFNARYRALNDEYFFYKVGYVDCRVWESWYRGMEVFFKHPRIQQLWDQERKADSYYGFQPPH
jgi:hypothetical protein